MSVNSCCGLLRLSRFSQISWAGWTFWSARPRFIAGHSVLLVVLTILSGCGQPSHVNHAVSEYTSRLARSLEQPVPNLADLSPLRMPHAKDLRVEFEGSSINLLEFLELTRCELHSVIAGRNSSLGRLAVASEQLLYEARFLGAVDACIESLDETDAALIQTLRQAKQQKLDRLQEVIWQATLGGPEFRQFWQRDRTTTQYPLNADPQTELALNHLVSVVSELLTGQYDLDEVRFNEALAVIRNREGGELLFAWQQVGTAMKVANQTLRQRERPLCFEAMVTPQAQIFRTVVHQYFVGGVQPVVANLDRRYFDVMLAVLALESLLSNAAPSAYDVFKSYRDEQLSADRASIVDHVAQLSVLMRSCGFLPSQAS